MFLTWDWASLGCVVCVFMGCSSATPKQLYKCDFEHAATCGFQPPHGTFTWMTGSGSTPTAGTGPEYDHTLGPGHRGIYGFIETSNRGGHSFNAGDKATITGPTLTSACPVTVTFYYLMFGPGVGSLAVAVHGHPPTWSKTGQQQTNGRTWAKATILLKASETSRDFQIDFIGTRGKDAFGDIAIDDVVVTEDCTAGHPTTTTTAVVVPTVLPGTTGVLVSCNFETSCTQFTQSHTDNVDWASHHGHTQTSGTGPDNDHTTATSSGTYLYMESSTNTANPVRLGSTAALVGPSLTVAHGCSAQLVFFYSMYGPAIGKLQVMMHGTTTDVWHRTGQQHTTGSTWSRAEVDFPPSVAGATFQFDIVATRGSSYKGDIAIDDIAVRQVCSAYSTTASPTPAPSTTTTTARTPTTAYMTTTSPITTTPDTSPTTTVAQTTTQPATSTTSNSSSRPTSPLGNFNIQASPANITLGLSRRLDVTCSFSADTSSDIETLTSLTISKTTPQNPHTPNDVASINLYLNAKVNRYNSFGANISGGISAKGVSVLKLEWLYPNITAVGSYECQAYVIDSQGHPTIVKVNTEVKEEAFDIGKLFQAMKEMDSKIDVMLDWKRNIHDNIDEAIQGLLTFVIL